MAIEIAGFAPGPEGRTNIIYGAPDAIQRMFLPDPNGEGRLEDNGMTGYTGMSRTHLIIYGTGCALRKTIKGFGV